MQNKISVKGNRPLDIVIVGGGSAGWMAAAALARACQGRTATVTLVESEEIGTIGVGEATIPPITRFNQYLGLDLRDFIRRTQASFKLGIAFRDWTRIGHDYFHQFGAIGLELQPGVDFHNYWLKQHLMGEAVPFEEYSINAVAAKMGRFTLGIEGQVNPLVYAYHFDATLYARLLRHYAESRGVVRREGKVVSVSQHPETGFVTGISLADGTALAGDFFIDCSGFRGLLIEETLKTGYEDWSHWLPCDRAVAQGCASIGELAPYTRSTARPHGWQWRIPLQHRTGNGYVYCSASIGDEEAHRDLLGQLDGKPQGDPRFLRFTPGRRNKVWNKNVVAVGLSGGFLEPLESTSIHLIQSAVIRLLGLFPNEDYDPLLEAEFNRLSRIETEHVRDFVMLHYHATERSDSDLWNHVRTMELPDSLRYRLDLFRNRGRLAQFDEQLIFNNHNWPAILVGQNCIPERYNPVVDALPWPEHKRNLDTMRHNIHRLASAMPGHKAFIEANCPALPAETPFPPRM
jgi:tryptophan halogenase